MCFCNLIFLLNSPAQSDEPATEVSPDSDEFVLVLLSQCEKKLQLLHEELQGNDLAAILKEMEEEEVRRSFTFSKIVILVCVAGLRDAAKFGK